MHFSQRTEDESPASRGTGAPSTRGQRHSLRVFEPTRPVPDHRPTFLFGVGCQKGGTTWLYNYLVGHPDADMGFRKEYHVHDAIHLPSCRSFIDAEMADGLRLLEWFSQRRDNAGEYTMLDFYASIESYYDFFEFIARRRSEVRLVGDLTPSYAGLPRKVMASVRDELERRGFSVRVLFLLRDPVERVWSHARMLRRNNPRVAMNDVEVVRAFYRTPSFNFRTRYDETIRNLEAVFEAEQLRFEFYETLFTAEAVRGITDFLNVAFVEPDFTARHNASPKTEALPEDIQREIADFYGPVYEFCAAKFGADTLRRLWPSYRFLTPSRARQAA